MAVPAIFAFYCAWVVAMLLRPFFVFVLACLLWNAPFTMLKMRMVADTFLYMVSGEREGGLGAKCSQTIETFSTPPLSILPRKSSNKPSNPRHP